MKVVGTKQSTHVCTHPEKTRRREEAQERQAEYNSLTLQQKYDRAVERGHENTREAVRLRAALEASGVEVQAS